jgi:indole-3-glycerol phosphate synthase
VQERFAALAHLLPDGWPAVAESGVASGVDARRVQQLGYRLALIGTALMASGDPSLRLREIFDATRTVQP